MTTVASLHQPPSERNSRFEAARHSFAVIGELADIRHVVLSKLAFVALDLGTSSDPYERVAGAGYADRLSTVINNTAGAHVTRKLTANAQSELAQIIALRHLDLDPPRK